MARAFEACLLGRTPCAEVHVEEAMQQLEDWMAVRELPRSARIPLRKVCADATKGVSHLAHHRDILVDAIPVRLSSQNELVIECFVRRGTSRSIRRMY